jgi:hypothetical protein
MSSCFFIAGYGYRSVVYMSTPRIVNTGRPARFEINRVIAGPPPRVYHVPATVASSMTEDESRHESATAATASGSSLSLDTVFELLANRRRRFALYSLTDAADGMVDLAALIEDVATLEAAQVERAITRHRYLDVGTDLYEWHLPVLTDVGLIECDVRHGTIRYWQHPHLETWVDRVRSEELRRN